MYIFGWDLGWVRLRRENELYIPVPILILNRGKELLFTAGYKNSFLLLIKKSYSQKKKAVLLHFLGYFRDILKTPNRIFTGSV
jgi:hypothetical protein